MTIFINILTVLFIGWPACFVGYLYAAMVSGFKNGQYLYDSSEEESIAWTESINKPAPAATKGE